MKKRLFLLLNLVLVLSLLIVSPASAKDSLAVLRPGKHVTFQQNIPVNLVFIGYEQDAINRQALRQALPATYIPIVRYPAFYGVMGRDLGLKYNLHYNITFAERNFTNRFFSYLQEIGTPGDLTLFQQLYNDQENNVLDITGPVLYIDGPSVEAWLADNLKVKPQSYTMVFINWYSRPDFQFHVYTKTDEPDPDTGHNFGEEEISRLIDWGGTSSRIWFNDLSAGPEWNTDNWNVDQPDLDEDGTEEYRMPPIWEYTEDGYRDLSELTKDLGLITRYVAINLLFLQSPLYDPLVTAPDVGGGKVVHINMFEDDRNNLGVDWIDTDFIVSRLSELQPYYDWQIELEDRNPIDDRARRAFRIFTGLRQRDDCWNDLGDPFAELFCFFDANLDTYVPAYPDEDYVIPVFAFNTTDARMGDLLGLLGFADDNWRDGTQTYVFEFGSEGPRSFGFGFSRLTDHEVGHHIALSHPHDGYDSELGLDYGPGGEFYYVWAGDASHTVMSYLWLTGEFGQFNQDNMYRWEFAGYLNWANDLLDDILADSDTSEVQDNLAQAEAYAAAAKAAFDQWDYLTAAMNARLAYEQVAMAADELGIATKSANSILVAPSMSAPHEGDWIRPK
ncbi:MAG TPA: hypothetical protein VFY66_19230 [Anaerolineales bacterium]|nr:hypothetical protein [Anaerolineales bacterium]